MANTEEIKSVTFKVQLPVCDRSDEFDGTEICSALAATRATAARPPRARWHRRLPARPAAPADERLEIDARRDLARPDQLHRPGPHCAGQQLAGGDGSSPPVRGGWQNIGLVVWQADGNFSRSTLTHSLSSGRSTSSSPRTRRRDHGEGTRARPMAATPADPAEQHRPVTIKMRYTRVDGSKRRGQFQVVARRSERGLGQFRNSRRRSGACSSTRRAGPAVTPPEPRIGLISAGNLPGMTGANPSKGTRPIAKVDYFRIAPDMPDGADPNGSDDDRHGGAGGSERHERLVHVGRQRDPRGQRTTPTGPASRGPSTRSTVARSPPTAPRSPSRRRHAHDRVPLHRQGQQHRGHQVADGRGRQGCAGDDCTIAPTTPGNGPATLTPTATDPVSGVAKSEYQVNQASLNGVRRPSVADFGAGGGLQSGLQAGLHRPRRPHDRVPLDRQRRQRRGHQDGRTTIDTPNNDHLAPVTTGIAGSVVASVLGPHVQRARDGEVSPPTTRPGRYRAGESAVVAAGTA